MWFSAEQIETPALKKLVQNNRNRVERELAGILVMVMENHDLEQLDLCPMDELRRMGTAKSLQQKFYCSKMLFVD